MHNEDSAKQAPSSFAGLRNSLGHKMRTVRLQAGVTTRNVGSYSSGHISNVENGRTTPSAELIGLYVAMGGDGASLLQLLDKVHQAGRTAPYRQRTVGSIDAVLGDPRSDPRMLRRGYDVDVVEDVNFIHDGRPSGYQHTVGVRPKHAIARYFPFRHSMSDQPRRGTSKLLPGADCSVAVLEESANGGLFAVLEFDPSAVDENGRCWFTWTLTVDLDANVQVSPRTVSGTNARVSRAGHRVEFSGTWVPDVVWWWRSFDDQEGLMDPPAARILPRPSNDSYRREFLECESEWWGFGWR